MQYLQLSANRLRQFSDIIINDYCMREDTWSGEDEVYSSTFTCYYSGSWREAPMEEKVYKMIEKVTLKQSWAIESGAFRL